MQTQYDWRYRCDPVMKSYRWWIALSVILALIFHLGLFLLFERIPINEWVTIFEKKVQVNFEREKIMIDDITLQRIMAEDEPLPRMSELPKEDVTMEDALPELPKLTESVKLTPAVSEPQNLFAAAPAPVATPELDFAALDRSMNLDLNSTANDAVKSQLAKAAEQASSAQPKIVIDQGETQIGDDSDDLVKQLTENLNDRAAAKIRGRFDSLDDLLGRGKSMPDNAEILIPTDLLFGFGEAEVRESAKLSLMKLGMLIMANPDSVFVFKGHTDSIPFKANSKRKGPRNNQELSLARAQAVRDWLVDSLGLEGFNLKVNGYGSSSPLVSSLGLISREERIEKEAINRRVEVEIIKR